MKDTAKSTGIGFMLGQVIVWALETFVLADPIPAEVAIAIGGVLTGAIHSLKEWYRAKRFQNASPGGTE